MRYVPIIALIIVGLVPVARAQDKSDRLKAGISGAAMAVETFVLDYTLHNGKTAAGKKVPRESTTYDQQGNILEHISFRNPTGEPLEKLVYNYDSKGRCVGYDEYYYSHNPSPSIPRKHVYTLDERGRRTEYRVLEADGSSASRFVYEYDLRGNKIAESYYSHTGESIGKLVFVYDGAGNEISRASLPPNSAGGWKSDKKYDKAGRPIEWRQYQNGKLRYKISSAYDEKGRVLSQETVEFNPLQPPNLTPTHSPIPGKIAYTYDDKKRTEEVTTYVQDGSLTDRVVYTYDEKGNEIGIRRFNSSGSSVTTAFQFYSELANSQGTFLGSLSGQSLCEFEYDSAGNWTKKTFLIQGENGDNPQPYRAELRVITYR
ncbi:hypothetical protein BH10ACI2_BH10ACI2_08510 [soil metagenome]